MPLHLQPKLRAREEALEDAGLIQVINSDGVTRALNSEAAGQTVKQVPVDLNFKYNGKSYKAK